MQWISIYSSVIVPNVSFGQNGCFGQKWCSKIESYRENGYSYRKSDSIFWKSKKFPFRVCHSIFPLIFVFRVLQFCEILHSKQVQVKNQGTMSHENLTWIEENEIYQSIYYRDNALTQVNKMSLPKILLTTTNIHKFQW